MISPETIAKIQTKAQTLTVEQQKKYFTITKFYPHKLMTFLKSTELSPIFKNSMKILYNGFVADIIDARLEIRSQDQPPTKLECERYGVYHYNFWRCVAYVSSFTI